MRIAAGAASAWIAGALAAQAGAFNPEAGRGLAILTSGFADAPAYRDASGRLFRAPGYDKFETVLHVEYGLTPWLAVIARPRFVATRLDASPALSDHGLGVSERRAGADPARRPLRPRRPGAGAHPRPALASTRIAAAAARRG